MSCGRADELGCQVAAGAAAASGIAPPKKSHAPIRWGSSTGADDMPLSAPDVVIDPSSSHPGKDITVEAGRFGKQAGAGEEAGAGGRFISLELASDSESEHISMISGWAAGGRRWGFTWTLPH